MNDQLAYIMIVFSLTADIILLASMIVGYVPQPKWFRWLIIAWHIPLWIGCWHLGFSLNGRFAIPVRIVQ